MAIKNAARCAPRSLAAALAVIALAAACTAAAAERDLSGRWGLGVEGGWWKLTGGDLDYSTVDQIGGVTLSHGLSRAWTLQMALRYGHVRPGVGSPDDGDVGWSGKANAPLYTPTWQPTVRVLRRFNDTAALQPFLGAGIGVSKWKVVDKRGEDPGLIVDGDPRSGYDTAGAAKTLEGSDLLLTLEAGLDAALSDRLALTLGARLHLMPGNELDNVGMSSYWGPDFVDANTSAVEGFLGLTLWFGSSDRDHDGVVNSLDGCPLQAEDVDGFQDQDGCPDFDNDGDGLADGRDRCSDEAEDFDGFQDHDGCPDPDNDGDGVADGADGCPDEAEDADGFQDEDGCPDPDNDGDGVMDAADRCPDTPAGTKVDANGCEIVAAPPAAPAAVAAAPAAAVLPMAGQTLALEHVAFESGSARLTAASLATIESIVAALREHPDAEVEIRGHTDATGPAEVNLDLSQRRAISVRDALVQRGVAPGRVTAVGYGEDFPVADNGTPAGRAANRRVEIHRVR